MAMPPPQNALQAGYPAKPTPIAAMLRLPFALLSCLLVIAPSAWADGAAKPRPLNLSLPRDILDSPASAPPGDETVERNLQAPAPTAPAAGRALPYGAGYEHRLRQFEHGAGAATGGTGGAAPGAAGGRRGR